MNFAQNRKLWEQRVEDFKSSQLTQEIWCQQNDLKVTALRYWLKKIREESISQNEPWVKLEPAFQKTDSTAVLTKASLTIHIGSYRVEVADGFCHHTLKDLVSTLSKLC